MGWGVAVFIGKYMGWPRGGHGVAEFSVGVAMGWPTGWMSATPATPSTPKETSIVHSRQKFFFQNFFSKKIFFKKIFEKKIFSKNF